MVYVAIEALLVPLTRLRIGSSRPGAGTDLATYTEDGEPRVPGSTVKGVLRSSAHLAAGYTGFTSCGGKDPEEIKWLHQAMFGNSNMVCDVCRLFGSPGLVESSVVRVTDFTLPSHLRGAISSRLGRVVEVLLHQRTHVTIDRVLGRAREGSLFSEEAVPPLTPFIGRLELDYTTLQGISVSCGLVLDDLKLLLAAMVLAELVGVGAQGYARFYVLNVKVDCSDLSCCSDVVRKEVQRLVAPLKLQSTTLSLEKLLSGSELKRRLENLAMFTRDSEESRDTS